MSHGAKCLTRTTKQNKEIENNMGLQLYTLNVKKQVKKEGPRTNQSSAPLPVTSYVRRRARGP